MTPRERPYQQAYVEITNACGLACSFCPGTDRPLARMAVADFRKVAAQVEPLAAQVYLHLMGEPLEHPGFGKIIGVCAELGLPVNITTNGMRLGMPVAGWLLEPIVRQVSISVHAWQELGDDVRESLTVQCLEFLRQARERRPDLYLNCRLWNATAVTGNHDSAGNREFLARLEQSLGMEIPPPGDLRWRKSRLLQGRLYLHFDTRFAWPGTDPAWPARQQGFCHALGRQFGILATGEVVPCCLDRNGTLALGNCLETPLAVILQGPRASAMRQGFRSGRLVESLCQRCPYSLRFGTRRP